MQQDQDNLFHNLTAIITRPADLADNLVNALDALGCKIVKLPAIRIEKIQQFHQDNYPHERKADAIMIFLSSNAVLYAPSIWQKLNGKIFAIGPTTAQTLTKKATKKIYVPITYSSEGLLEMPQLKKITNQIIYIFCGAKNRTLLEKTLQKRGAIVKKFICYCRKPAITTPDNLRTLDPNANIITITTSGDIIKNLHKIIKKHALNWLLKKVLLIPSTRYENLAKNLGFNNIIISDNPSATAITNTIIGNYQLIRELYGRKKTVN